MSEKIYGLLKKHYNQLSENEQEQARQIFEANQKVKAMQNRIVEECRKQGFTIGQMDTLANYLKSEAEIRRMRPWSQLF